MNKYTLITGSSSGLGLELAKLFGKDGNNLLLISSNQSNLDKAKEELLKEVKVDMKTLAIDLSNPDNFRKVKEYTDSNNMFINNLINCAGFGDRTDFKDMDIGDVLPPLKQYKYCFEVGASYSRNLMIPVSISCYDVTCCQCFFTK